MKEFYQACNFRRGTVALIEKVNGIVAEYVAQGYRLTVRQLYYQLVARDIIPNTERSYKNTVRMVNDGRLAGLIDWDAIEDRTRDFIERAHWSSGKEILDSCAKQFHMDMWQGQEYRVFVLVEKEALAGVLERSCRELDIPLLAARGYPSASVLREFANERLRHTGEQPVVILHLGDHDPSGIDMTRDLEERLRLLSKAKHSFALERIALNMDQVEELNPPPNPAKVTDSRFEGYAELYGDESWELDALSPAYLNDLVTRHAAEYIDRPLWEKREKEIASIKRRIAKVAADFR